MKESEREREERERERERAEGARHIHGQNKKSKGFVHKVEAN